MPGFAEAAQIDLNVEEHDHNHANAHNENHQYNGANQMETTSEMEFISHSEEDIVYFEIDREYFEEGLQMALEIMEKAYAKSDLDLNEHPFWKRIREQPSYKEEIFTKANEEVKRAMHTHKSIK